MPALRKAFSSVWRVLRAIVDKVPFTPLGLLLAGAAAFAVIYFGRQRQDMVLYVVGLALGGLLIVSWMVVSLSSIVVAIAWRAREQPAQRLEAGTRLATGFTLPALGWLPLVSLRWEWLEPAGVDVETELVRGRFVELATHRERGSHLRTVRRVIVEDVFGLGRIALRFVEVTPRVVLPAKGRPMTAPLLEAMAGGDAISHPLGPPDGDLVEMRRYVPGDPMKRVLWKTFARSRQLMVRLPERAFSPTRRTLAFVVAGEGDEASAGVARLAVETQAFGPDWRLGADSPVAGPPIVARTVEEAIQLIVRSRAARPRQGLDLGAFLEQEHGDNARCIVFAPAKPGPWLDAVEAAVKRRAGSIEFILGADGVIDESTRARWRKLFLLPPDDERVKNAAKRNEVDIIANRLRSLGAGVSILDRQTGKWFGRGARRRVA